MASQTGPLTTHFQLHGGLGRREWGRWGGGRGESALWLPLSQSLAVKCGDSGMAVLLHPSTPPASWVPTEEQDTAGVREQGSQCALTCSAWGVTAWSVLVHIQFQEGLKFTQLGVNRITLTPTSPLSTAGAEVYFGGESHTWWAGQSSKHWPWAYGDFAQNCKHCTVYPFSLPRIPIKPGVSGPRPGL